MNKVANYMENVNINESIKMDNRKIGMFDSGVGGLTVYKEIKKALPHEKIIYLGDTKRFPYGSKTKETIIELTKRAIDFLVKQNVKAVVIACGTATSQALKEVKGMYDIPIIGIIDSVANYIKEKGYSKIGIIATRGTIKSRGWEDAINKAFEDTSRNEEKNIKRSEANKEDNKICEDNAQCKKIIEIQSKACPLLAPMAEEGWTDNEIAKLTIKEYLKDFKDIQALVLGCTHYPLFEVAIKECLPNADIINAGCIIAENLKADYMSKNEKIKENCQELKSVKSEDIGNKEKSIDSNNDEFYLTEAECNFVNVAHNILNKEIEIRKIDI